MLFSRGVWSVFGIRKSSQARFEEVIKDGSNLLKVSQSEVLSESKTNGISTFGINPFEFPRLDEQLDAPEFTAELLKFGEGTYGFWGVQNGFNDVTDPKSKQEAHAYKDASKPFKFLSKDEKKLVEANVVATAVPARTQFPVLIDFNSELVYVASGNVDQVGLVRALIVTLGGEDFSLAWQFDGSDWPQRFLSAINDSNKFSSDMEARAEELSRFRPEEVEKLDDKVLENIVSNYFSLAELDTGMWAGLSTPARIRVFRPSDPASVSNPSVAFSLLKKFNGGTQIAGASVVFQSLESRFTKSGDERQVRINHFTLDVNDNVNLSDVGAAMLRGFDIPTFKKNMKKAAKNRGGSMPINEYWKEWLSEMKLSVNTFVDNVTETLHIDKQKFGLKPYLGESAGD